MATNLEELRAENAELAANVESEVRAALSAENASAIDQAAATERRRLAEIDEIANLYDDDTVREAKYGEHPCTAAEMAFRAAKDAAKKGDSFMKNVNADYSASGADKVGAAQDPEAESGKNEVDVKASAKADVEMFKKMKGVQ